MKILDLKNYSLITKVLIAFFIITFLSISIRTVLAQPKIKEKNFKDDINFVTQSLLITKDLFLEEKKIEEMKNSLIKNLSYKTTEIKFLYLDNFKNDIFIEEVNINNNVFVIWYLKLNISENNKNLFLKLSIEKDEIENKNSISILILFLLPETLLAIFLSISLLFIIFKRMLNNIELLNKQLSKSLEEKETLLKEVHHRVKNNLALTISLIELQEEEIKDIKTKKTLNEIQERIFTMELLHRKLYESEDLNKISFKDYIEDLINSIKISYDKGDEVLINPQIEEIFLTIENAMPYGLILNELITNAFKYAFLDVFNPTIYIKITKTNNILTLIIKDNGKGLKKDFKSLSDETLGLKLVNNIVKLQLQGEITYSFENGAKFFIEGKIKE
jgi:two-component sensor histidine kinase